MTKPDEPPRKLKAAIKIVNQDRRKCIERLSLFWGLDCYAPKQIYAALLGEGWVWVQSERKWINANDAESEEV